MSKCMFTRCCALLLAVVLTFGVLPPVAFATEADTVPSETTVPVEVSTEETQEAEETQTPEETAAPPEEPTVPQEPAKQEIQTAAAEEEEGETKDYASFIAYLKVLEGYADSYAAANSGKAAAELVINFIRTGVDRYNDGNWKTLAGEEIVGFTNYVKEQDAANGTKAMYLRNIVIDDFKLPNGDLVDFGHMFGTLNIAYVASVQSADLGGWAGDICDLILYSKHFGNVPAGTIDEQAAFILQNCFGVNADDAFGMDDFYGDMDAFYLDKQVKAGKKLSTVMESYFTAELSDGDRSAFFMNNRFKGMGLETKDDLRKAVHDTYTANVGLQVLEADRDLSDETELRQAACYAFADYLFQEGGDRMDTGTDPGEEPEEPEDPEEDKPMDNEYYSVFSSTSSVLAPGITQKINYAITADDKQIVYYVATVDVTRDDVTIMANYKDNDPSKGWGMQRVMDQANAMIKRHTDPSNADLYIENFTPVVATNGDGYNMSTGEPGGLLVMEGKEWHGVDNDGFFAILKDGSAMIGTKADYAAYKDQIQEAIGGFGATLIKDGEFAINKSSTYYTTRASRTAIGIKADGSVVMMVLDGRQEPFSAGGSMEEIAQIMLDAGCVHAINLDGGGSTTYLSKPEGSDSLKLINRPSDGSARSVAASLVAVSTAKSSKEFDHANITSDYDYLTIGTELQLTASGVSNTGSAAPLPEGAVWAVSDETIGSITAEGVFTAAKNGDVEVQLKVGDKVVGSKALHVVVPDDVAFDKEAYTAIFDMPTEVTIYTYFDGNPVAFNANDIGLLMADKNVEYELEAEICEVSGLSFTVKGSSGLRELAALVFLMNANESAVAKITVYRQDEAFFDFDNVTAGDRQLAWQRNVSNATTNDNTLYHIEDSTKPMDVTYTFGLDMKAIDIPEQLEDLTYMLPGSDTGATAWDFLLSLAERISVLTEVKIELQLDPNLDVDISELTVSNDYFYKKSAELDENNKLTLICKWHDQTQAIPADKANPICILSGIKATPKDGTAWNADKLIITNEGQVSYRIYLRASSLYSFAQKPENQEKYGLMPYSSTEVLYNGGPEQGAYFSNTYAEFSDSFTLDKSIRQGWMQIGDHHYYFVDNKAVTGIHELPSREDPSVKQVYEFEEDGVLNGTYTGLYELNGKYYYAMQGQKKIGWISVYDIETGESGFYYFDFYQGGAAVNGQCKVEGFNYLFVDYKCVRGELVKNDKGIRYRFAGLWQRNQWITLDDNCYFIGRDYYLFTNGLKATRTIDGGEDRYHLFNEEGVWQREFSGLYDVGNDTYLIENGIRMREPGLVYLDGYYYYFCANDTAIKNRTYWPTKTNGLLPVGPYNFDEYGRITNVPAGITPPGQPEPTPPVDPEEPDVPDTPEEPVKDGIVYENGGYFYYKNGVLQYAAGLIQIGEDYYYIRSNGQAAIGRYWVTTHNGLMPAGMYTFGADGKMITEPQEPDTPDTPDEPVAPKNGFVKEFGAIYYYKDGKIQYCAGLIYVDGYYYYVRSNGQLAQGSYWTTNHNDLLPEGLYNFDEEGRMTNPPSVEKPGEPAPEQPKPEVKNGIVEENGILYYYIDGTRAYAAGVVKLTDEAGKDFYIYVRSNAQLATGIYWPTNTNGYLAHKGYDWGTNGRLYL